MRRKIVAVLFGGRSGEHVVSLRSAASIMEAIDRERYQVVPVGISREGILLAGENAWQILWEQRPLEEASRAVFLSDPVHPGILVESSEAVSAWEYQPLDLVFPVLHGSYGEDGTVQGLLELAGLPYVGSGVLASAVAMDKAIMKMLFQQHGLPVGPFISFFRRDWPGRENYWRDRVGRELGYPSFVKPANLGSSVGINRVTEAAGLVPAVKEALLYDDKVLVEANIPGREIECSVLGDLEPRASRPGEIIPCNDFYDYRAKYIDDHSALVVPVELGAALEEKVREWACAAFKAVEASGLARVDFFVDTGTGNIVVNEINSMPGFTSISMFPKLWEASGLGYGELVSRLLELAEARYRRRLALRTAPPE